MSDGPHRSLPMQKWWKELAKRGDQQTYDTNEVIEAATGALASDLKNEVKWSLIDALKSIFTGRDNSLQLPEIALQELEAANALAAGSVFGMSAVKWSKALIAEGRFGLDAFYDAIGLAAKMRGFANIRQIQEHYLRQSSQQRSNNVSKRLQDAISSLSEGKLGSLLAASGSAAAPRLRKKNKLDDGVPL